LQQVTAVIRKLNESHKKVESFFPASVIIPVLPPHLARLIRQFGRNLVEPELLLSLLSSSEKGITE
jgi:hypothetical protein